MTLPRLLKMAMHLKFADATLRNVYHVGTYSVECASDNKHLLLTLASGNGFDIAFGLDAQIVLPSYVTWRLARRFSRSSGRLSRIDD
ncbi:hypothetical protein GA0061102_100233 [Rhizobium miluonense]|uniref:Uncharacterized protein n=1 Tax=Rhizobium miluonense TaxID=411945 RepID=A0A1C3U623_9HYPH|nr:hypothetical protein GA0061102_100233 [Rhizobium miluonense]